MKIKEYKPKLDSFEIWIERNEVEILNENLISKIIEVYEYSGEIRNSNNCKPIYIEESGGITYRTGIKRMPGKDYITLIITAKMLKEKYFDGININNIKSIYETIINQNIIYFEYESLLNALVRDIDICIDLYKEEIQPTNEIFMKIKEKCNLMDRWINIENRNTQQAIYFNERNKGSIKRPYLKLYDKGLELETKSKQFKENYLSQYETDKIIRIEATIKNHKIAKNYFNKKVITEYKNLKELLNIENDLNNDSLKNVVRMSINKYLNKKIKTVISMKTETPTEAMTRALLRMVIECNELTKSEIINECQYEYQNENYNTLIQSRERIKKYIEKQIDILVDTDKKTKKIIYSTKNVDKIMKAII